MLKYFMVLLVMTVGFAASADDCPAQIGDQNYLTKVTTAIHAKKTCEDGATVAEACSLGASGDIAIAGSAQTQCEGDFLKKLSKGDLQTYRDLLAKCDAKYRGQEGTMYLSMNAFCHLQVARLYSELYSPVDN